MATIQHNKKPLAAKLGLAVAMLLAGNAAQAAHFFYTGGHDIDMGRLAALGHTASYFNPDDAGWNDVLSGTNGAFNAIIIGEGQDGDSLSPATRAAIASYVSNGGRVIIVDDHYGSLDVTNTVFGFSASLSYGCQDDDSVAGSLQPAAAGTSFDGGPATVANSSCTSGLVTASLPASAISMYAGDYFGTPTTTTFVAAYGTGVLAQLGFDLCCGTDQDMDDWYVVLDNAYKYSAYVPSSNLRLGFSGPTTTIRANSPAVVYARLDNYGRDAALNPVVNINVGTPVSIAAVSATGWTCTGGSETRGSASRNNIQVPIPVGLQFQCRANAGTMPRSSIVFKVALTTPSSTPSGFVTISGNTSSDSVDPVPGNNAGSFKLYVRSAPTFGPVQPPIN